MDGEKDYPYILSVDRLVSAIPGARLVTVPDTDHLSIVAHPRFKEAVLDFLSERG